MQHELAIDFGVDAENRGWGAEESGYRCGLPFRGNGRPIRASDPEAKLAASRAAGLRIEVNWPPDVSWRKRIEVTRR